MTYIPPEIEKMDEENEQLVRDVAFKIACLLEKELTDTEKYSFGDLCTQALCLCMSLVLKDTSKPELLDELVEALSFQLKYNTRALMGLIEQ